MNHLKRTATSLSAGLALLLGAAAGSAQTATPQNPNALIGSDTLNLVMDTVLGTLIASGELSGVGILTYNGLGSTSGERAMEGSTLGTTDPPCLPAVGQGGANPGCQEISPMSRHMFANICNDEEAAGQAEGLAICSDGLVVVTNNAAAQQFAVDAASCTTGTTDNAAGFPERAYGNLRDSGTLPNTGYVVGGGLLNATTAWRDVLRIIYTGCQNTDGTCTAADRVARCSDPIRQELVNSWANLFEGANCGTNACTQLRQAYRRDDNSGTTGVFLELLAVSRSLTSARQRIFLGPNLTAIPANYAFCDGGQLESFWPDPAATRGDPIKRACAPEDDLCGLNGQISLVRAVRTPLPDQTLSFPPIQCTRGRFANAQFLNTALPVCPDGTVPRAGLCKLPFFASGTTRDFNCLNDVNSRPATAPLSTDGRSYNYVMRNSAGTVQFVVANVLPEVAQWRQNMAVLDTVIPVPGGPFSATVCNQVDATRLIGCLVANTTCTFGWAGREAASIDPYDNLQEPVRLRDSGPSDANINAGTYPFARELFVNAIGGFENITAQCQARLAPGTPPEVCADQVRIAREFYDMTPVARNACTTAGYIPLAESRCVGAQASAGCGAPTVQAKTACQPL